MSEELIKLEPERFKFFESTYVFFQKTFDLFDIEKLIINFSETKSDWFQIYYSYSIDKINYADFKLKEEYVNPTFNVPYYIGLYFKRIVATDLQKPITFQTPENVNKNLNYLEIDSINYDSIQYDLKDETQVKFQTVYELINQFPRWNFYDNQQVTINRWLAQCNAIAEMYGHQCIYFKTEPVESETVNTLANHPVKNVTNIKKLHIIFPNNQLPENRNSFTEWDMPLVDDVVINIVKEKFEQAFGLKHIPDDKDFLYLPLLNKMFRVSSMQPKNGFMGKIGWYEVYLAKYEDDSSILIDDNLKTSMENTTGFDEALQSIDEVDDTLRSAIFDELNLFKLDTVETDKTIAKVTVEEKKEATQNFTNKLVDSTNYVSLKETDALREFYDRRLQIVSVNPDTSAFPITMYTCESIEKRVIALQYKLNDYNIKNKFGLTVQNQFKLSFNFVLLKSFQGELFDILNTISLYTIKINRSNKIEINVSSSQENFITEYQIQLNEIYNIEIEWNLIPGISPNPSVRQISFKIFGINNSEKTLEYQNIYIDGSVNTPIQFNNLNLYGGYFYSNDIKFEIEKNLILNDVCNPLLIKFK